MFGRRSRDWVLSGTFSCINSKDQTQSRTMTSQSPRIYIYKITFEEVLYYYYGVKKEKYFNEEYWGSPKTNKWCWKLYTPKKQILEIFPFTDEGWLEAQEIEKRLIKPLYNTDKWCLNENCGGMISLEILRKNGKVMGEIFGERNGKINGRKILELGIGIHGFTAEETKQNAIKGGTKAKELGLGIHGLTFEQRSEIGKKNGKQNYENKTACFSITPEKRKEAGKKANETNKKNGTGLYGIPTEKMKEKGRKNYENKTACFSITPEQRIEINKKINSQRWECTETGYITTSGPLTLYQRKRGIDTSKRIKIS